MDLRTAAGRLGVHYQTAYRWVRDGSLPARKRGSSYDIAEADLAAFMSTRDEGVPPPKRAMVRSWDHFVDRLFAALTAGDELAGLAVTERLREGGVEPPVVCGELLVPVMRRVGDAWQSGELSVAEEHRASAICERLVARLSTHPRGRPRGVAVVTTCSGEEHSLPAAMATVALRADRWQVHHLGTQVPAADLIDLVRVLQAELVVLSSTMATTARSSAELAEAVSGATTATVLVGQAGATLADLVSRARSVSAGGDRTSRG